jgi:hypothetical protein
MIYYPLELLNKQHHQDINQDGSHDHKQAFSNELESRSFVEVDFPWTPGHLFPDVEDLW